MKSILILGQSGQVTTYLQKALNSDYQVIALGSQQLDLTNTQAINQALAKYSPSLIINPAAYTAVDLAETEQEQAYLINRDAVAQIADYCRHNNTPLIHYSTDYVFSGDAKEAYTEQDAPAPNGVYGLSKYEGEQAILKSGAPALILRTSWVYSNHGKNFYKTMLNLAETRDTLSVVSDQFGSPTYAGSIADATKQLVDIIFEQGGLQESQFGIYHFTCNDQTSWHGFANAIFDINNVTIDVQPVPTEAYPTPAKRPAFSVLNNDKLAQVFGVSLPNWQTALQHCASET